MFEPKFNQPLGHHEAHNTAKEKIFLDGIFHGEHVDNHSSARARLALTGYLKTITKRKFDDGVSASSCLDYAKILLDRC